MTEPQQPDLFTGQRDPLATASAGFVGGGDSHEAHSPQPEPLDACTHPAERTGGTTDGSAEDRDRLTRQSEWSNWTVLAMIILCFFVIVRFRPFARGPCAAEGQRLAELQLHPLSGGDVAPVDLAHLTGRVVLINFWSASSAASREQLAQLARLHRKFRDQAAFRLLCVSCGRQNAEDVEALRAETRSVLQEEGIRIPTYADLRGVTRRAVDRAVGLSDYPTTLIIDRLGRIRGLWVGYREGARSNMEQMVAQLLAEG